MVNMLRALADKVVRMQEWMDSVSREMEKLRKSKQMLEINDVTEMKNIINGLISRLYTDENIISELDNTAIETLITE